MRFQIPSYKVGMGLNPSHFSYLEQQPVTDVAWFEATTEDYMSLGRPLEILTRLRQEYPVALHGSHLNIGNPDGPSKKYIQELRDLIERVEPFIVSDHLCWSGSEDHNMHGCFPFPLNTESLTMVSANIDIVQSQLKMPIAIENIARYVEFECSDRTETDFLRELSNRTGCGLVLDLAAVTVNAANHKFSPIKYLQNFPMQNLMQVHLSGPTETEDYWLDKKASDISKPVWDLFKYLAPHIRHLPIAIERLKNVPDFNDLEMEVIKASFILENSNENERSTELV